MHLVLASPANTSKQIKTNCLIDTGCSCPLIIPEQMAKDLGLEIIEGAVDLLLGGNTPSVEVKRTKLTLVLNTLEAIYRLPCMALVLEESKPIIGTPVLDIICRKTGTRFVMDFQKGLISFE